MEWNITHEVMAWVVAVLVGIIYSFLLAWASKKNKRFFITLLIGFCVICTLNILAECYVIPKIAEGRPVGTFSLGALAVSHSLELFLFQTHFFDNGYQEFFFGHAHGDPGNPFLLYVYVITYVLACITSAAFIIRSFTRKRAGRSWLKENKGKFTTHIFFLGGEAATMVARSLKEDPTKKNEKSVFVGYPDPYNNYVDLSIWEKIEKAIHTRKEDDKGPFDAIVYSSIPLNETSGTDICAQMGLEDLESYLKNDACKVYLLSDDEKVNLHCADLLTHMGCAAEIYCRAVREGVNLRYEDAIASKKESKIHLVDSSYLAMRTLKNVSTPKNLRHKEALPVNFVKKGKDSQGRLEGWVDSSFNSMILGFGELGHEALGYLYEYGAFIDKDGHKSKFSCMVLDNRMDHLKEAYCKDYPGMNAKAGIQFKETEVGSDEFWEMMTRRIRHLNYIVVCLGNDALNLTISTEIVKLAYRVGGKRPERFVVVMSLENPSRLDLDVLDQYNNSPQYNNLIHRFGSRDEIWTYDNVTNESLDAAARNFALKYNIGSGDSQEVAAQRWEKRERIIQGTDIREIKNALRKKSQDYANCFHMETKMALVGPEIKGDDKRDQIADAIPKDWEKEPIHYKGDDPHVAKVLHNLAVLEHIRWEASHVAMGYKPGTETDVILRTHKCIAEYDKLDDKTQHYDYLVAKTTLELYQDSEVAMDEATAPTEDNAPLVK